MKLTDKLKREIDAIPYEGLLRRWRFAPAGDEMFQGESGIYWAQRVQEFRTKNPEQAIRASKKAGWRCDG